MIKIYLCHFCRNIFVEARVGLFGDGNVLEAEEKLAVSV